MTTPRKFTIPLTTDASGDVTAYSPYLSGVIEAIQYVKTDFADGVDFTITAAATGETIWTESNVNAAVIKHPRAGTHSTVGVALLYAAGGAAVSDKLVLSRDRVKVIIGSGGDAKIGSIVVTLN